MRNKYTMRALMILLLPFWFFAIASASIFESLKDMYFNLMGDIHVYLIEKFKYSWNSWENKTNE